jgi:hypothetical protein
VRLVRRDHRLAVIHGHRLLGLLSLAARGRGYTPR